MKDSRCRSYFCFAAVRGAAAAADDFSSSAEEDVLLAYRLPFSLLTANRVARDFPTRRMGADKKKRWSGRQGQRDQQLEINGGAPSSYDAAYPNRHGRRKINRRAKPRHPSPSKLKPPLGVKYLGTDNRFCFWIQTHIRSTTFCLVCLSVYFGNFAFKKLVDGVILRTRF
jgi:hypothetical protein